MTGNDAAEAPQDDFWPDDDPVQTFGAVKLAGILANHLSGRYRWCKELGWLAFTGNKWEADSEPRVLQELVRAITRYTSELMLDGGGLSRENLKELLIFSSAGAENQAIRIARGAPGILTDVTEFDAPPMPGQPWTLPCENGVTVEMHGDGTIRKRPTRSADLNTHTACAYDPDATAKRTVDAFEEYQPDPEIRRFMLQQWARGLSGMGSETFTVNLGEKGGNGKGTMQGVLESVAGDYAVELPVEVILKGNNSAREVYRSELAQLRGARLVFCDEPEEDARYNLGMLKKITGGGTLQGRQMGKEAVTFQPRILFQMASNNRPSWSADGGMKRRYVEIMWNFEVDPALRRESFKEEIRSEAPGFLNLILDHWTGSGPLIMPGVVLEQTAAGVAASSPVAQFAAEALVRKDGPGAFVSAPVMYRSYEEWCRQGNQRRVTANKFGRELTRLQYERKRTAHGYQYQGVEVLPEYLPWEERRGIFP